MLELARGIDVREELRIDLHVSDVQVLVGAVERERALREAIFQYR